ncbi:hypothetical protein F5Y00DRAFT_193296 [Daldinia vernicosa]|uniref:uncharacterized protein n=1 Tax=Daldinia vernicosa TaxID=114800 RepID=UPI00200762F8|nr:uncharacterized protein F5Y00DRAFT_193296 [Daldinia vernicosa]KAI0852328.1 hypothetical protein F5Y00DRAFT_193296 [Daldinia vernicosa]
MLGQDHNMRMRSLDPSPQVYSHSRSRTSSSSVFPQAFTPMQHLQQPQPSMGHTRRSPSVNTFSTTSSNTPPAAYRTSPTADIRRSTSSRSGSGPPTSYVALLRKQKATVWCDRSQSEDPRLLAQQRLAKQRANQEVTGSAMQSRTSTGIGSTGGKVAAKIRHHGKPGVVGYTPDSNYMGVSGVPMRLSATEVEGEDGDEDDLSMRRLHHRRTGSSGRSSTASSRRGLAYRTSGASQSSKRWSPGDTPERPGSMVIEDPEYTPGDDNLGRPQSTRSGSSAEKADALPELGSVSAAKLASNSLMNAALTREKSVKNPEDLRRRGSVDERTMTLTSGRLFIANPD